MAHAVVTTLTVLLALVGMANAVYFTLVYYGLVRPDARRLPVFCRMDEETCASVVFTRYGCLLGVPNSLPGIGFYLLVLYAALAGRLVAVALAAAGVAVTVGVYLVWALVARLRTSCPLCLAAHAVNIALALLLLRLYLDTG